MSGYALKQPHPNGSEWIQEFDSREEAVGYQADNGGVLVRRQRVPGQPGLWWVEVDEADDVRLVTDILARRFHGPIHRDLGTGWVQTGPDQVNIAALAKEIVESLRSDSEIDR